MRGCPLISAIVRVKDKCGVEDATRCFTSVLLVLSMRCWSLCSVSVPSMAPEIRNKLYSARISMTWSCQHLSLSAIIFPTMSNGSNNDRRDLESGVFRTVWFSSALTKSLTLTFGTGMVRSSTWTLSAHIMLLLPNMSRISMLGSSTISGWLPAHGGCGSLHPPATSQDPSLAWYTCSAFSIEVSSVLNASGPEYLSLVIKSAAYKIFCLDIPGSKEGCLLQWALQEEMCVVKYLTTLQYC